MEELYMDEKWKFSKKGSSRNMGSPSSSSSSSSSSRKLPQSHSTLRCCSFARRCAALVKEQRARFYIMRRCIIMLVCWREYSDC